MGGDGGEEHTGNAGVHDAAARRHAVSSRTGGRGDDHAVGSDGCEVASVHVSLQGREERGAASIDHDLVQDGEATPYVV
eukprot:CAMPEP_0118639312 /NCGR_PEP_ID=MMETSP0785-20121206/4154_1 /TAXON_ID=91992 /ORGANISM="Bolidomonas pacifica, Strain CCMP 1866" /LENGTH=78 /DNA_ID=CAMNT_0006530627 /DNA_START=210 /DNA_END=446 /DNA_ORIENTATION=+